jgi:hypothetical protein
MARHTRLPKPTIPKSLTSTFARRVNKMGAPPQGSAAEDGPYGMPQNGRGAASFPQFDPYENEWGNQLEED